jgi:hypothetical protein
MMHLRTFFRIGVLGLIIIMLCACSDDPSTEGAAQLSISELMTANTVTAYDPDFFNFNDWIELANHGPCDIHLGGYTISEESGRKTYRIPDGAVIQAKGYLLLWADNKNTASHAIHTTFELPSDVGSIVLMGPNGAIVDQLAYPRQTRDISYGRSLDQREPGYMVPTPGSANHDPSGSLSRAENPVFSLSGGFYHGPVTLALETAGNGDAIHYTLDGAIPSPESAIYGDPLLIHQTTVVRAVCYGNEPFPSEVLTTTYFIHENGALPYISLAIDPAFFWDDEIGIYPVGTNGAPGSPWCNGPARANYFQDWERAVSVTYFDQDGHLGFAMDAGLKIAGACSRILPQKSFDIKMHSKYGRDHLAYRLFENKPIDTFEEVTLRNSGNDWEQTMLRDGFMHTLVLGKTDIDCQAYRPVLVFLNGAYWGIYNLREKINESYLEENHGVATADLLENDGAVKSGSSEAYDSLMAYISSHDLSDDEHYRHVASQMDIDEYIDYQVSEMYFVNTDWPGNNMVYWRAREAGGRWRWILHDTDFGFGLKESGVGADFNMIAFATQADGPDWPNPPWSTFLLRNLLKNKTFKNRFVEKCNMHLSSTFAPERVIDILDRIAEAIEPEIQRQYDRWSGIAGSETGYGPIFTTIQEWRDAIEDMRKFADARPDFMRKHLKETFGN